MGVISTNFIFFLQFVLIIIGTTGHLTVWFNAIPAFIGLCIFTKILLSYKVRLDQVSVLFLLLACGYIFRSTINDIILRSA